MVRRILPFLGAFFVSFSVFFDFLMHFKPWCVFSMIFFDFGSIFGGLGRVWGRFLEVLFADF